MDWKYVLQHVMKVLPVKVIVDAFVEWLTEVAEKTENKLDDRSVEILQMILYTAFGWSR